MDKIADVVAMLASYIQFNSVFGSGVANLAGEIGARQDLFREPCEPVDCLADRSVEIAAKVFYAAVDEFGDQGRSTHRMLAQATLKACAEYVGVSPATLNQNAGRSQSDKRIAGAVCDGYGLNQRLDERQLFRGIGFHLGSETLADEEFCVLDKALRERHPELVAYLEKTRISVNGNSCNGYLWIRVHTTVEAEHSDAALIAANMAMRYYAGADSQDWLRQWILDGAQQFATVQLEFMQSLGRCASCA